MFLLIFSLSVNEEKNGDDIHMIPAVNEEEYNIHMVLWSIKRNTIHTWFSGSTKKNTIYTWFSGSTKKNTIYTWFSGSMKRESEHNTLTLMLLSFKEKKNKTRHPVPCLSQTPRPPKPVIDWFDFQRKPAFPGHVVSCV